MAVIVSIDRNDGVRFRSNGQIWPRRQIAGTVAEENEKMDAMHVRCLSSCLRKCHVQFPILVKIAKSYITF